MKKELVQIRISEDEKDELNEIANELDIPASQIVREGIRGRITELRRLKQPETVEVTEGL